VCWCVQGDLLLLAAGSAPVVHKALDRVRQYVAKDLKLVDDSQHCLLWVTGEQSPHHSLHSSPIYSLRSLPISTLSTLSNPIPHQFFSGQTLHCLIFQKLMQASLLSRLHLSASPCAGYTSFVTVGFCTLADVDSIHECVRCFQ
jgi:hypothetical protein